FAAHAREPRADGLDRELRGIAGDADADEAGVGRHVVDAVRHDLAQILVLEVVHVDAQRIALRPIVGATILEVADQLFLLRIDGDDGLAFCLSGHDFRIDVLELRVTVQMLRAFLGLRLYWREKPSFTSSLRTVSALIGCPMPVRIAANLSMLFDTHNSGRMGSPSVAGSRRRFNAGTRPGSLAATALRPAPARRTRPFGSSSQG